MKYMNVINIMFNIHACSMQSGLGSRLHRCASSSSEYPFLTDITGKFVVCSNAKSKK